MNVTLSITDEVVQRAREVAHQQGTSLNALVRGYLERLAGWTVNEELVTQFDILWRERVGHSGGWHFNRDELYEERLNRGSSK